MKNNQNYFLSVVLVILLSMSTAWQPASARETVTENRDLKPFNELSISGAYKIILMQGDREGVVVSGEAAAVQETKTVVEGTTLKIFNHPEHHKTTSVQVTVYFKSLNSVSCSGALSMSAPQPLNFNKLELDNSGSSAIELELNATDLDIDISGSGSLKLSGKTQVLDLDISGSGSLKAASMQTQNCEVSISGAGVAELDVAQSLDVSVSGSGMVKYKGEPKIKQDISGSGKVMKL